MENGDMNTFVFDSAASEARSEKRLNAKEAMSTEAHEDDRVMSLDPSIVEDLLLICFIVQGVVLSNGSWVEYESL
jgi:hypothetical protein